MAKLKVKKLSYAIDHIQEIVNDKYLLSAYGKVNINYRNTLSLQNWKIKILASDDFFTHYRKCLKY